MKQFGNSLMRHLPMLALLGGAASMTVGAGMVYLPAGFILGGVLTIIGAVLSIWGEGAE